MSDDEQRGHATPNTTTALAQSMSDMSEGEHPTKWTTTLAVTLMDDKRLCHKATKLATVLTNVVLVNEKCQHEAADYVKSLAGESNEQHRARGLVTGAFVNEVLLVDNGHGNPCTVCRCKRPSSSNWALS